MFVKVATKGIARCLFVQLFVFLLVSFARADGVNEASSSSFQMGDAILRITSAARTSLYRSDGSEIGKEINGFRLRYEDGRDVYGSGFRAVENEADRFLVSYEDGSVAKYKIEKGDGFTLFTLEDIVAKSEVAECFLLNVSIPDLSVAGWINTVTLEDDFKVGVMTASINALPLELRGKGTSSDLKGCSHTFAQISCPVDSEEDNYVAEFRATSTLDDARGWAVQGKDFSSKLDLSDCVRLRARVRGDGKGEYLKIQLGGATGHRDDYINIDFDGWKICELDAPQLNDLSYDDVRRLYFYYNSYIICL